MSEKIKKANAELIRDFGDALNCGTHYSYTLTSAEKVGNETHFNFNGRRDNQDADTAFSKEEMEAAKKSGISITLIQGENGSYSIKETVRGAGGKVIYRDKPIGMFPNLEELNKALNSDNPDIAIRNLEAATSNLDRKANLGSTTAPSRPNIETIEPEQVIRK